MTWPFKLFLSEFMFSMLDLYQNKYWILKPTDDQKPETFWA